MTSCTAIDAERTGGDRKGKVGKSRRRSKRPLFVDDYLILLTPVIV